MKRGICECLAGLAAVAAARGRFDRAAMLLAAAETHLESNGAGWWPADRVEVERTKSQLLAELGEIEFEQLRRKGQDWELNEAIDFASGIHGERAEY